MQFNNINLTTTFLFDNLLSFLDLIWDDQYIKLDDIIFF